MNYQLYQTLIRESSDVATIIDPDGTITYVSPAVRDVLGYAPDELIGANGYGYQHPDDRSSVASAIDALLADPDETRVVETRFRHADGSWCWIEAKLQNRLEDDEIDGILVNSRDIGDRKRRQRQMQDLAEEYEMLLDTVEDAIFFLEVGSTENDYTFQFKRLNRAYEEQTGFTTADVRGRTPRDVFGDELGSELRENYRRCVEAGEPITYQEEVPVETGARFWQTNLAPVVADGEVTRIVGITRNVTGRVEREKQLRRQKERLDEFSSVVAHDLRNPLNVAKGRTELLAEECDSTHLTPIVESLDRMEEIISDTLTLARHGQIVSEPESIALTTLIETCWNGVSTEDATLELEETGTFEGDRSRLHHVFENLFRNAIEHGGSDVTIRVGWIDDDGIYVEDTGPGIPETDRTEVFETGYASKDGGTGFGLAIVRRIAEAHGWDVSVTDGTDGGARFEFTGVDITQ